MGFRVLGHVLFFLLGGFGLGVLGLGSGLGFHLRLRVLDFRGSRPGYPSKPNGLAH